MTLSAAEREAHIRELAVEHAFALELVKGMTGAEVFGQATADDGRFMRVRVIWHGGNLSYLAALHEVGHIALGHIASYAAFWRAYEPRILEAEAEAWDWACAEAREPVSAHARRGISRMLGTYVRDYGLTTAGTTYRSVEGRVGGIQITQRGRK